MNSLLKSVPPSNLLFFFTITSNQIVILIWFSVFQTNAEFCLLFIFLMRTENFIVFKTQMICQFIVWDKVVKKLNYIIKMELIVTHFHWIDLNFTLRVLSKRCNKLMNHFFFHLIAGIFCFLLFQSNKARFLRVS
jgi:hypothetical protein